MFRLKPGASKATSPSRPVATQEDWHETRAETAYATQWIGDRDEYLATTASREIGVSTAPNQRELFVSCAPELALQQQFEHSAPTFIAVHDVATQSSRKLLVALAAASGRHLQTLTIRRQGFGTALAAIEYLELPTADGSPLRLYSTLSEADTAARHGIARTLLAHSQLGVVMLGDMPGHATAAMLAPFRDAMLAGPWPNRQILLLPLSGGTNATAQGHELASGTGVEVRATPQVVRPADAWGYIHGTWSRLRASEAPGLPKIQGAPAGDAVAARSAAEGRLPRRVERRARPRQGAAVAPTARKAADTAALFARYARDVGALSGVASCCIFEIGSGAAAASAGRDPAPVDLATQGRMLLEAATASARALGLGDAPPDLSATFGSHHLVLRGLPGHPGHALLAAFDRSTANLVLAGLQLQRLDALLDPRR